MDIQVQKLGPNYKQIYLDILSQKYPHKKDVCEKLLEKKRLSVMDVIELNEKIFGIGNQQSKEFNQSQRSYADLTSFIYWITRKNISSVISNWLSISS
jgi:hypothetical protein